MKRRVISLIATISITKCTSMSTINYYRVIIMIWGLHKAWGSTNSTWFRASILEKAVIAFIFSMLCPGWTSHIVIFTFSFNNKRNCNLKLRAHVARFGTIVLHKSFVPLTSTASSPSVTPTFKVIYQVDGFLWINLLNQI